MPKTVASTRTFWCRPRMRVPRSPARCHGEIVTARRAQRGDRAGERVIGSFTGPAWKSRSPCASTICLCVPAGCRGAGIRLPNKCRRGTWPTARTSAICRSSPSDSETARDFDDAVYCEPLGRSGYRLVVAIAGRQPLRAARDALDSEGFNRGNSVYFRAASPMLPERIVKRLCSAQPGVDRPVDGVRHAHHQYGSVKEYRSTGGDLFARALTYIRCGTGSPGG